TERRGVTRAPGARTYANRYAVVPGKRVVLMTNNDSAYLAATDLAAAGVSVAAVVDLRAAPLGDRPSAARGRNIEVLGGYAITGAKGGKRVQSATVMELAGEGVTGTPRDIECDAIQHSGGD